MPPSEPLSIPLLSFFGRSAAEFAIFAHTLEELFTAPLLQPNFGASLAESTRGCIDIALGLRSFHDPIVYPNARIMGRISQNPLDGRNPNAAI